jgi:uncharacterized iron-regulated membrane protein
MRPVHRIFALFASFIAIFLGVTGTTTQLHDLWTFARHAPANDPEMWSMLEGYNGPAGYQVILNADYTAPALPAEFDAGNALARVADAARNADPGGAMRLVEVRMADGHPVGQVKFDDRVLRFDAMSLTPVSGPPKLADDGGNPPSLRNTIKSLHRMTSLGDRALWINVVGSVGLLIMIATGLSIWWRSWSARRRGNRNELYWKAGGGWRTAHRAVALTAAAYLLVISLSGAWLAYESLVRALNIADDPAYFHGISAPAGIPQALTGEEIPKMAQTTLAAYRSAMPGRPVKAVRLRYIGAMPQGVFVAGGDTTEQAVFDARDGRRVSLTEPEYPRTAYPFGWQIHQTAKRIHNGSFLGMTGRVVDALAGLCLVYLATSGLAMYFDMWSRRRRAGRSALVWK